MGEGERRPILGLTKRGKRKNAGGEGGVKPAPPKLY